MTESSGAYPGGAAVGAAMLRFRGAGPYAHLDLCGEVVTVPAGARGTWSVVYRPKVFPIQPGGSVTIWKWGPKFVFGMALQDRDATLPDYCTAHVEPVEVPATASADAAAGEAGRLLPRHARVALTNLTDRYKRYRQATLVVRDAPLAVGEAAVFVAGDTSGGAPGDPRHRAIAVPAYTARDVAVDVQVDHDGDGWPETQHRLWIHVVPDQATRLRAVVPSVVMAGEPFSVEVRAEDTNCNPGAACVGEVTISLAGVMLARASFISGSDGRLSVPGLCLDPVGTARLEVTVTPEDGGAPLRALTNPMWVLDSGERVRGAVQQQHDAPLRVYWGEMHSHTTWCEGMATVEENYRFAREDACLDWYSASEHIMLGPGDDFPITDEDSPPASSAVYWQECQAAARRWHRPGRFVTFTGYEWTAFLEVGPDGTRHSERHTWGDHCVWFLDDTHPLVIANTLDGELTALAGLANDALARGERPPAMIIPHSGGGSTDWTHYAGRDLVAMPLVETTSQHAHAEWFYQRALQTGRREGFALGVCGMDDGHMGHPGYDVWSRHGVATTRERAYSVQGGLTAVLAPALTREALWDAFFDRRTYATSGERMLLDMWVEHASSGPTDPRHARAHRPRPGALSMGQTGTAAAPPRFRVRASGTAPLDLVEIIRDDRRVQRWVLPPDTWDVDLAWTDIQPPPGQSAYYVRITQRGDAFAWSSPIWLTYDGPGAPGSEDSGSVPAWNDSIWPPVGTTGEQAEAAGYLPALNAFLARQGAAGRYVDLRAVGMFREHRGRYALFRGSDAAGNQIHMLYYPDFAEDRIRVGIGWADFGVRGGRARPQRSSE